ncbi:MAG: serine protease, partial [Chloroflexota bacterium]
MKKSRLTTIMLAGMALFTLLLVGAAAYLVLSEQGLLAASGGQLRVYIQADPVGWLGQEMHLVVTVQNDTGEFLTVDEIRLPNRLVEAASVVSIVPGSLSYSQYQDSTGYRIGYLLAPGAEQQFSLLLVPFLEDDLVGDVTVVAGERQAGTGFRLTFEMPVAVIPTFTPTATLPPMPTATFEPLVPTATPVKAPYGGVVRLVAKVKHSSYLRELWRSSGTLISSDGLILTNAHLVTPVMGFEPDVWVVGITTEPDQPPEDLFYAEPLVVDKDLDLTVMRITTNLRYRPVNLAEYNLTPVPLGDSNALELGQPLLILGYPGIGGETITLTRGDVGGFTASKEYGERSYIKTS